MKKIIFDFDSTLVKVEALDELAKKCLESDPKKDEIINEFKKITNLGMIGEISFPESLRRRISLIRATKNTIEKVAMEVSENISNSVLKNKEFFLKNKKEIYIVSGGFKELILPTAKKLGILEENIKANEFVLDEMGNLLGVQDNNCMTKDQGKVLQVKAMNLGKDVIVVGDGWTDYEIKEAGMAHKFIAYTENVKRKEVVARADMVAKNFNEVADLLNY